MSTPPDPVFTHGSKAEFYIGTASDPDTLVDISERINKSGLPWQRDKAEVSTFKSNTKKYVVGLKDAAIPLEGPYDPYLEEILSDLMDYDDAVSFRYRPAGTGTGKSEYNGKCKITKLEISTEVTSASAISSEAQVDGEVPRTTQS